MDLHNTVAVGLYAVAMGYKVVKPTYKLRHSQHHEGLTHQTQVLQGRCSVLHPMSSEPWSPLAAQALPWTNHSFSHLLSGREP